MISDHAYIYSMYCTCVSKNQKIRKRGEENSTVAVVSKNM